MKEHISSFSLQELETALTEMGEQKWRAKQIYEGVMNGNAISEISNISKTLKEKLLEKYEDQAIRIHSEHRSKDGTRKFLYLLSDDNIIEGVLMEYKHGNTLCVSTQVGCRMGCTFCASGRFGLNRNLTAGEILSQVLVVNKLLGANYQKRKVTNIVLMGSGEPLDNYANVSKFLHLVSAPEGIQISQRNISLSTCGLVSGIKKLTEDGFQVNLTISLHAPTDEKRRQTMKIANVYSIAQIIDACKGYFEKTGRRVIFEYCLIKNVNSSFEDARILASILKGFPLHVNLIPLNETYDNGLTSITRKEAYAFCDKLASMGISATVRRTMGDDVGGACGQLKNTTLKNNT